MRTSDIYLICVRALLCSSSVLQAKKQAQRCDGLCLGSRSQGVVEVGLNPTLWHFKVHSSYAVVCPNEGICLHEPGGSHHCSPGGTRLHKYAMHNSALPRGPYSLMPASGPLPMLFLLLEIQCSQGLPHPLGVSSNVTSSEKPSQLK